MNKVGDSPPRRSDEFRRPVDEQNNGGEDLEQASYQQREQRQQQHQQQQQRKPQTAQQGQELQQKQQLLHQPQQLKPKETGGNTPFLAEECRFTPSLSSPSSFLPPGFSSATPTPSLHSQDLSHEQCGCVCCRPRLIQSLASMKTFIVLYLTFAMTHAVQGSYTLSVLTTIEKRFNLNSSAMGALIGSSCIGQVISSILLSAFFSTSNQPRAFAISIFLTFTSAVAYVTPHFIYDVGDSAASSRLDDVNTSSNDVIRNAWPQQFCEAKLLYSGERPEEGAAMIGNSSGLMVTSSAKLAVSVAYNAVEGAAFMWGAYSLFVVGELMHGVAAACIYIVGPAYVDDNTKPSTSSKLIGIMWMMRLISPVASFGLGAYFLTISSDISENTLMTFDHPLWIGAWWIAYLIFALLHFLIFLLAVMLPQRLRPLRLPAKSSTNITNHLRDDDSNNLYTPESSLNAVAKEKEHTKMKRRKEQISNENDDNLAPSFLSESPTSTKKFQVSRTQLYRLATNWIFVGATVAVVLDCAEASFAIFLPKYVEVHFQLPAWKSNVFGGLIPWFLSGMACLFGGLISGKIKGVDKGLNGNVLFCFLIVVVTFILSFLLAFVSCDNHQLAAARYNIELNATNECSALCKCDISRFDPVCDSSHRLYVSPCYAGCSLPFNSSDFTENQELILSKPTTFNGCSCSPNGTVSVGFCPNDHCENMFIIYVCLTALLCIAYGLYYVPFYNIILRCVKEEDKSLALAIQTAVVSISILILAPAVGGLLDLSCVLAEGSRTLLGEEDVDVSLDRISSDPTSSCRLYDKTLLRQTYRGLYCLLRALSVIAYSITWILSRRRLRRIAFSNNLQDENLIIMIDGPVITKTVPVSVVSSRPLQLVDDGATGFQTTTESRSCRL